MKIKRIMIAAPKSGSGKTAITCALLKALKDRGEQVVSYKCGPDYIDPMFHEQVLGISAKNLDTFFTGEEETRALFLQNRTDGDFAVLEGVMGLFDGLGGVREEGSSYHLSKVTKTPIVLVVDAKGMGRSVAALLAGFLSYDREHLIRGVILNRMSKAYYEIVKPLIEEELPIKVLGYVPEQKDLQLESRHLGLVMPNERKDIKERLQAAAEKFAETVSLPVLLQIAESAEELDDIPAKEAKEDVAGAVEVADQPVIAVAKDEAFCFYYKDNLQLLQENGAELKYFSPLHDAKLPEDCNALLFGGGYPELYAEELGSNIAMREAVKREFSNGMPVVAECGGFLYLHETMTDKDGASHPMAGVLPAGCADKGRLVRFGYIELKEKQSYFLPEGECIKAHEFHYFDSTQNGADCLARKPVTGRTYPCVIEGDHFWLGFPHLYYPSNPCFPKEFVRKAREYKKRMELL